MAGKLNMELVRQSFEEIRTKVPVAHSRPGRLFDDGGAATQIDGEKILSVNEVSAFVGMSSGWVYQYYSRLGGVKIGGSIFFKLSALLRELDNIKKTNNKPKVVQIKKKTRSTVYETDPSRYFKYILLTGFESEEPEGFLEEINIDAVIEALKQTEKG